MAGGGSAAERGPLSSAKSRKRTDASRESPVQPLPPDEYRLEQTLRQLRRDRTSTRFAKPLGEQVQIAIVAEILVDPLDQAAAAGDGGASRALEHQQHGLETAAGLAAGMQTLVVAAAEVATEAATQATPAGVGLPADASPAKAGEGPRSEQMPPFGDASRGVGGGDRLGIGERVGRGGRTAGGGAGRRGSGRGGFHRPRQVIGELGRQFAADRGGDPCEGDASHMPIARDREQTTRLAKGRRVDWKGIGGDLEETGGGTESLHRLAGESHQVAAAMGIAFRRDGSCRGSGGLGVGLEQSAERLGQRLGWIEAEPHAETNLRGGHPPAGKETRPRRGRGCS